MTNLLQIAGWWVLDYAYAAFWQCRAVVDRTDAERYLTGTATPVVIVPGIYETWRFLQPLIQHIHGEGHPVHVISALQYNAMPVADAAILVGDYLKRNDLHDVVLVAHSKGGLIGKYVMTFGTEASRVRAMLAIAAPFGGSRYARWFPGRGLRIFRPDDQTIVALGARSDVDSRIVSVYGRFDPHIPEGSKLPGAKNVELDAGGHFRVLAHPRVMAELAALSS